MGGVTTCANHPVYAIRALGSPRECLMNLGDNEQAISALHLSNTEFGDTHLIVERVDEDAIQMDKLFDRLEDATTTTPMSASTSSATVAASSSVPTETIQKLMARNPLLSPNMIQMDPERAEEISRTVYVGNIAPACTEAMLIQFFADCGPVTCAKMAGDPNSAVHSGRFAFVEFATWEATEKALSRSACLWGDRMIK